MKNYLLTIQFSINAVDDPDARIKIFEFLQKHGFSLDSDNLTIKLQEVFGDKKPRKVNLK